MTGLEREGRRRARLKAELDDEGICLELDADDPRFELVLDEIVYARHAPVHEQRQNSYGALVFGGDEDDGIDFQDPPSYSLCGCNHTGSFLSRYEFRDEAQRDLRRLRQMCDGLTTFLARRPNSPETLFEFPAPADELRLTQNREPITILRTPAGSVKIFAPSQIYTFDRDEWSAKPYAVDATYRIADLLLAGAPKPSIGRAPREVLDQIVSFSLHVLSPRHVGATFVWHPVSDQDWGQSPYLADAGSVLPARTRFAAGWPHPYRLATFLGAVDGACLVASNGEVERVEAKLTASATAIRLVREEGGLRHTSAKRYSFDDPHSIVFVVSHDGPVTVYSDGINVAQLRNGPTYASTLGRVQSKPEDVHLTRRQCGECERWLAVDSRSFAGSTEFLGEGRCPICERLTLQMSVADNSRIWPLKPWSSHLLQAH